MIKLKIIFKNIKDLYIWSVYPMIHVFMGSYKGTIFPDFFLLPWKTTRRMTFFCSVYHVIGKAHNTTTCCDTNWPRRGGTLLIWGHQSKFTQTETYKRSNQPQGKQIVLLSLSILTSSRLLTFSFSSSHLKDMITQLPVG